MNWNVQQSALPKTLELYIYDSIEADYYDYLADEKVESETSSNHLKKVLENAGEVSAINIYINSLGGSVKEGLGIYSQLKRHNAYKTVYIDGYACSIASVIAMAGDKVIMPRNTMMMIHNAWTYTYGNAQDLRKAADDVEIINAAACQSYLMKTGGKLTEEKLRELLDAETWLTASQCIEYGLADEYGEEDANLALAQQMFQENKAMALQQFAVMHAKKLPPIQKEPQKEELTPFHKMFQAFIKN